MNSSTYSGRKVEAVEISMLVTGSTAPIEQTQNCEAPIRVQVFRHTSECSQIEEVWREWQRHPNCDYDYYRKILETLPGILGPHVLVAYRAGQPEAMLIGRVEKSHSDFLIGYKTIASIPVKRLTLLHGGWVGSISAEVAAAFVQSLRATLFAGEADVAYFNHLRTDDPLYSEIKRSVQTRYLSLGDERRHRGMTLAESGEGFRATLSSKERNNQKRRERRIMEDFQGKVRLQTFKSPSELDRMITDIDCIAKKTYQRALNVGFEDTPSMRERLQVEAERGWLRAYVLYLNERPCAFWMGDVYAGTFYSGFTGYDSEFSKCAPGMFLLLKAMELLCDENSDGIIKTANFGLGDAEWKQIIGDLEWQESAVFLYAQSAKGKLLRTMQRGTNFVNALGKKALDRGRSLSKIKRLWRNKLLRTSE